MEAAWHLITASAQHFYFFLLTPSLPRHPHLDKRSTQKFSLLVTCFTVYLNICNIMAQNCSVSCLYQAIALSIPRVLKMNCRFLWFVKMWNCFALSNEYFNLLPFPLMQYASFSIIAHLSTDPLNEPLINAKGKWYCAALVQDGSTGSSCVTLAPQWSCGASL